MSASLRRKVTDRTPTAQTRAISRSVGVVKGIPVRVHLPNGEKVGLACSAADTFSQLKTKIWAKKGFDLDKNLFMFSVRNGELTFRDGEPFQRIIDFDPVFCESAGGKILECSLVSLADIGDQYKRKNKRPSEDGQPLIQGVLYKRGSKPGSAFRKRYFVLEGSTLFYFENESNFFNKAPATDFIPMGSVYAHKTNEIYRNKSFCFELRAEHVGKRNYNLCAPTYEDLQSWLSAIYTVCFRRVKLITINCVEELRLRNALGAEGIFRISGSKTDVDKIKSAYDHAAFPDLGEYKDEHAVAGVLKLCLREMSEPIIPFDMYDKFIRVGREAQHRELTLEQRVPAIQHLIDTLPYTTLGYLRYLMKFLHEVSLQEEKNRMGPSNLAVVFGPNLLRAREESIQDFEDSKHVLYCTQTMIEGYPIWAADEMEEEEEETGLSSEDEPDAVEVSEDELKHQQRTRVDSLPAPALLSPVQPSHTRLGSGLTPAMLAEMRLKQTKPISPVQENKHELVPPPTVTTVEALDVFDLRKKLEDQHAQWETQLISKKKEIEQAFTDLSAKFGNGKPSKDLVDLLDKEVVDQQTWHVQSLHSMAYVATRIRRIGEEIDERKKITDEYERAKAELEERNETTPPPPPRTRAPSVLPANHKGALFANALFDYTGGHRVDEVTFTKGTRVEVLDRSEGDQGWWKGIVAGKTGWFPATYVQLEGAQ